MNLSHHRQSKKGQTALETAFVLSMMLFLSFATLNLGVFLHTKSIATYAAFMAGRSFQVFGDQTSANTFLEINKDSQSQGLLSDVPVLAAIRVAEDIFTCALPWVSVPSGDADSSLSSLGSDSNPCKEGERKYERTNVSKTLLFLPFKEDQGSFDELKLNSVAGAFAEQGRDPMRYGILEMSYRSPILIGVLGLDGLFTDKVHVPVLMNPGIRAEFKEQDRNQKPEELFGDNP